MKNDITDIKGLKVGQRHDADLCSGVTVVVCDEPMVAAVDLRGGAPGTRDTELLNPATSVQQVDAITISGGSAFGLDAASGVQAALREQGRGFQLGDALIPIVPGAILFDLLNGGNKDWGRFPPYRDLAYDATLAAGEPIIEGSSGAGFGATTVNLKGGTGSASCVSHNGFTVAALVCVNAVGSATVGNSAHFWAGPFEQDGEFGGLGPAPTIDADALIPRSKVDPMTATTPAIVATNAKLDQASATRFAMMAQDGLARALYPIHTPADGDIVFAISNGEKELKDPMVDMIDIGTAATNCLARAIARAVHAAGADGAGTSLLPSWQDKFGG